MFNKKLVIGDYQVEILYILDIDPYRGTGYIYMNFWQLFLVRSNKCI